MRCATPWTRPNFSAYWRLRRWLAPGKELNMNDVQPLPASAELARILESARRLGVEMDEEEALQWLAAIAAAKSAEDDVGGDVSRGVFGSRVSMLDFSPEDLAHFREIGRLVEFQDQPGKVEPPWRSPAQPPRPRSRATRG